MLVYLVARFKCINCNNVAFFTDMRDFSDASPYPEKLTCKNCPNEETAEEWNVESNFDTRRNFRKFIFIDVEYFAYSVNEEKYIEIEGWKGEMGFCEWLNANNLPFVFFAQEVDTFSHGFQGSIKRPDLLLQVKGVGNIAVDVKNYSRLTLATKTVSARDLEFQKLFGITVWYAYSNQKGDFNSWLWISATEADRQGVKHTSKEGVEYLKIEAKHFTEIENSVELHDYIDNLIN
jgi:hypothetical protein